MIFDLKCNDTGVRCHQKEPKKIGFGSLGLKPVDRRASEVFGQIFTFFIIQEGWLAQLTYRNGTFTELKN